MALIFTQHYLDCLSHASYLVGDDGTGRAVVVDPRRDVEVYVEEAAAAGLTIERVIETHLHADFLSGHLELAARTGAVISYGDAAAVEFEIEPLHDGQRLSLGTVELEILSTPGHTPESICVVVREHPDDPVPYGVLTGDTLFVGDVGRPDLLASAGTGYTADVLGRLLYHSIHDKLLTLPDAARVFPAHGAGSACGKQLSTETSSTLGDQRRFNYALAPMTEAEFVARVTEGQPARPNYFEFDATRNRQLRPLLDEHTPPPLLPLDDVLARVEEGAVLLDTREPNDFGAGHLRRALGVGLQGRFAEYAGDIIPGDRDIVLVGDPAAALETKVRLARIGFDRVAGQLDDPSRVALEHPELVHRSSRLTVEQFAEIRDLEPDLQLLDIRNPGEVALGTIPHRAGDAPPPPGRRGRRAGHRRADGRVLRRWVPFGDRRQCAVRRRLHRRLRHRRRVRCVDRRRPPGRRRSEPRRPERRSNDERRCRVRRERRRGVPPRDRRRGPARRARSPRMGRGAHARGGLDPARRDPEPACRSSRGTPASSPSADRAAARAPSPKRSSAPATTS